MHQPLTQGHQIVVTHDSRAGLGNFSQFGRSRLVYSHAHNMLVFPYSQYSNLQYCNKTPF